MADRRAFLAGLLATGLLPGTGWADVGSPDFLAAALRPDGVFVLCGIRAPGRIVFEIPLPGRGHAAAAHPTRAEAVAFARRPGRFAMVVDCVSGQETARLDAPPGHHFYGHGVFSADGSHLFTTENAFDAARGMIGVWDATRGYRRRGSFASGGIGPHDVRLLPDGATLAVANGGIETHPETGRAKLNIPTMRPNLSYLDLDGAPLETVELAAGLHKGSIRHLAVAGDGTVAFAMQWQGALGGNQPLLGLHNRATPEGPRLARAVPSRLMEGYLGSIAISADGREVAVTSPRSGRLMILRRDDLALLTDTGIEDVCGVSASGNGFIATSGTGRILDPAAPQPVASHPLQWDNHLVPVRS